MVIDRETQEVAEKSLHVREDGVTGGGNQEAIIGFDDDPWP
jgi:hypothetical protein